jgi:hypothetical protein
MVPPDRIVFVFDESGTRLSFYDRSAAVSEKAGEVISGVFAPYRTM